MPKIKRIANSVAFTSLHEVSRTLGEKNDCTVKAFVLVSGASYSEAHQAMARQGRKFGQGMYGAEGGMRAELKALGFEMTWVPSLAFIHKYPGVHKRLHSVTTHHPARFNKAWKDGRNYLIFTRGHVAAVVNGETHDWSNDRACRATSIYRITKI